MVPIFTIGHKRLHRGKIGKKVGGKEVLCTHIYIYKIFSNCIYLFSFFVPKQILWRNFKNRQYIYFLKN